MPRANRYITVGRIYHVTHRCHNLRKRRSGAFWGDRYHATLVEGESHLWNCLKYIDLNMIRAGKVNHPQQWEWCGYHELVGRRTRYRLIDRDRLMEALGEPFRPSTFAVSYSECMDRACRIAQIWDPIWTESLAVGSEAFVHAVEATLKNRVQTDRGECTGTTGIWFLREENATYA